MDVNDSPSNATSDMLEQEKCITKLMQAAFIFWYKYQKRELIIIIQNIVETVWWKIVFEDDVQWHLIDYFCT